MDASQFHNEAPGQLVPTRAIDHVPALSGKPAESAWVEGMAFLPDPLPPSEAKMRAILPDLFDPVVAAERKISELEGAARRLPNPDLMSGVLSRREAILSSQIENTYATPREIGLAKRSPDLLGEPRRQDAMEVAHYLDALDHGLNSALPICQRLIREMHRLILAGSHLQGVQPGEYRQTQNFIGSSPSFRDARFVPPPPDSIQGLMEQLDTYTNQTDSMTPLLARLAMVHYQFETIHPFNDGNGRLGRVIVALLLCKRGQLSRPLVYASGHFEQNRQQYYDLLLAVSTQGKWREWIEFFCEALRSQAEDAIHRTERLLTLKEQWHARYSGHRSKRIHDLVDSLFVDQLITIQEASVKLDCTPANAGRLVQQLVEEGLLHEITGRAKDRIFEASEVNDLITSD